MPRAAPRPCTYPGCRAVSTTGRCERHPRDREKDARRGTAHQRGYSTRWRKARLAFLAHHPLCAECEREGRITGATVVDHIIPHRGDYALFWNRENWQPLCKQHHDQKTGAGG